MRIYKVKTAKTTLIVASHTPYQALQICGLKNATASEVNIVEPVIICQEATQTAKLDSTSGK